jgi:hypothetical protein
MGQTAVERADPQTAVARRAHGPRVVRAHGARKRHRHPRAPVVAVRPRPGSPPTRTRAGRSTCPRSCAAGGPTSRRTRPRGGGRAEHARWRAAPCGRAPQAHRPRRRHRWPRGTRTTKWEGCPLASQQFSARP